MEENKKERLDAYEKMQRAIVKEYETILEKLEATKSAGKVKFVTYQQYLSRKLMYGNMLSLYELYDLKMDE